MAEDEESEGWSFVAVIATICITVVVVCLICGVTLTSMVTGTNPW